MSVGNYCEACKHSHEDINEERGIVNEFLLPAVSFALLVAGIVMSECEVSWFAENQYIRFLWYFLAFLLVGWSVIREAVEGLYAKDYFNEFTLMTIAGLGAFYIGEYPEAVGVMLFYCVGETLQDRAVDNAKRNISRLIDSRSETVRLLDSGRIISVSPESVQPGQIIEIYPGERLALDGVLLDEEALFDTSALTGESMPKTIERGHEVLAGMISLSKVLRIEVTKKFSDSALSRILKMVNEASERKAPSEKFIRKFARIYTPVVFALAVLLVIIPWILSFLTPSFQFIFSDWLYRALIFLVISCPCALVLSVPLSYFAGIGAASRAGILFKGGNFLDAITKIDVLAFDKTGTLTTGKFTVVDVVGFEIDNHELLSMLASAESASTHPLARAVVDYSNTNNVLFGKPSSVREKAGYGTIALVDGKEVIGGSLKFLREENIPYPHDLDKIKGTIIACSIDKKYRGYVLLADTIKADSKTALTQLNDLGVKNTVMLSGDKKEIVEDYAGRLGIKQAYGEMLPEDKAKFIENLTKIREQKTAFVGDGMNDAPVLALSDVGIAMGALGSDAAIESADVVIQNDNPSAIATAIKIGKTTRAIVKQNIAGAIIIKTTILILGTVDVVNLWIAVFADVGVALLAVLNSMRIMWKKY